MDANLSRGEELYTASKICDTFLDTASLSSFAAWMGYLMPHVNFFTKNNFKNLGSTNFLYKKVFT
jgi:hypothetical protein